MFDRTYHYHEFDPRINRLIALGESIMATLEDVQAKLDGMIVNNAETAAEVSRVKDLVQALRDNPPVVVGPVTQEQLDALDAKLAEIVGAQQGVEDSLRETS